MGKNLLRLYYIVLKLEYISIDNGKNKNVDLI